MFQRDTVFPWRTVEANIGYGLEIAGVAKAERAGQGAPRDRGRRSRGFDKSFPRTLSGGMRQRVALMRTLIMEPEILLMDEPFGALDTHTKLEMHKTLLEIWERERQTVLFVTHDLGEALTLSSRIILLSARPGRLKEDFEVPFSRPRDAVSLRETDGVRAPLLPYLAFARRGIPAHEGGMTYAPRPILANPVLADSSFSWPLP